MTKDFLRYAIGKIISTHTLTWSVTIAGVKLINALYDFNSHAHVERDRLNFLTMKCIYQISTHTLTWSVTNITKIVLMKLIISTHTLTWSVTKKAVGTFKRANISTHTLTWSVTDSFEFEEINGEISTHTLTWSVT